MNAILYAFNPVNIIRELFSIGRWGKSYIPICSALMIGLSLSWGSAWWEIVSAVTGVICVVLVAERKLTNFFWGLINCSLYGLTSYYSGFYGDMSLNWALYVPFQIAGLLAWYKNSDANDEVFAKRLGKRDMFVVAMGVAAAWMIGAYILTKINGAHPYADSANVVLSVAATILMWGRYREQWACWILVNLSGILMWGLKAYYGGGVGDPALLMWVAFLANSIYGYWSWTKASRMELFYACKAETVHNYPRG